MELSLKLSNTDSVRFLRCLPEDSIDCTVTSPPYGNLRTYGGYDTWDFEGTVKELYRVMKPGGTVCWNVADETKKGRKSGESHREVLGLMDAGFWFIDTIIYKKNNAPYPSSKRYRQEFEYVFIFTKGEQKTFNPIMDRKNKRAGQPGCFGTNTHRKKDGTFELIRKKKVAEYGMRGNVWEGNTRGQEDCCRYKDDHPAKMPRWLARDLIISYSDPGDVISDPFSGSGTTGEEAIRLNRSAILNDINPNYDDVQRVGITKEQHDHALVHGSLNNLPVEGMGDFRDDTRFGSHTVVYLNGSEGPWK